ncbi:helix-turn-helix domain-containing protein [Zestomonas carbonaria]|uniref:HTH araC/xylS-type domain-containing protein n=1 Tax=Zestomonas carbonaria TaxID=2762745 RepID=A0A7U7ESQ5_9GAMM|nr:helix-turn-helix domain-containing protein [Pseudomonas carbonaria]CAD5110477.1 hypothetical protein PSEWESI4_04800 [Pseudomonas carbonaria]
MPNRKAKAAQSRSTPGRQRISRREIITKVLKVLPRKENKPLRLVDLCKLAGVSERTLRSIFLETFGIGPCRYLRLRRLHLLRAALAVATPSHATVAGIAARFGYSDCGRMATEYHALFGEYPSQTLSRGVNE